MNREYRAYYHHDMGYCAMMRESFGWQQVSLWYTTLNRLVRYWGAKNGLSYNRETNRFTE